VGEPTSLGERLQAHEARQKSRYRARYYDQTNGRFLGEDPRRYEPTNFYPYARGNPILWKDPFGLFICARGANCDFIPELTEALFCFEKCFDHPLVVTCGANSHPLADPHMAGSAADIGQNTNPGLTRPIAEKCFKQCFPQKYANGSGWGSYAQQEYNSDNPNDGTHFHFQYGPDSRGGGFSPGIHPHGH
jgi:RHS repeat-associated protein